MAESPVKVFMISGIEDASVQLKIKETVELLGAKFVKVSVFLYFVIAASFVLFVVLVI